MAGERQRITDQNQWATVKTGDSKSSVSLHLRKSNSNTLVHRGLSCHQLFVLLCHSQQAVPALPQQLHGQRRLPGTRHARFLHPSSRTSSERVQELPTLPVFATEKVHVGIERNRALPTKWRTGSSRRCVGGSRHMVDSALQSLTWKGLSSINVLGKCSESDSFLGNGREAKCVAKCKKYLKMAVFATSNFKIFRRSMPPDPPSGLALRARKWPSAT